MSKSSSQMENEIKNDEEESACQPTHPVINSQMDVVPTKPGPQSSPGEKTPSSSSAMEHASESSKTPLPQQSNCKYFGRIPARPKRQRMAIRASRLETFNDNWPKNHYVKPDDLARAGLYRPKKSGIPDLTRCFFCGGGLTRWEKEDNPLIEHARLFSNCGYIRQYLGNSFIDALEEVNSQGGKVTFARVKSYMEQMGLSSENEVDGLALEEDAAVKAIVDEGYDREAVCAVAKILKETGVALTAERILAKLCEIMSRSRRRANRKPEEVQELEDRCEALRNKITCKVCLVKEVNVVFLPCNHLVSCQECEVALQECPVCRGAIQDRIKAIIC